MKAREMLASGDWDGALLVWAAAEPTAEAAAPATKKAKGGKGSAAPTAAAAVEIAPSARLSGHQGSVSALCWPTAAMLYSGSWDGTIREWNVEAESRACGVPNAPRGHVDCQV